jgi:hypothetical protein
LKTEISLKSLQEIRKLLKRIKGDFSQAQNNDSRNNLGNIITFFQSNFQGKLQNVHNNSEPENLLPAK